MPNLGIIIASTRPGRVGLPVGTWFAEYAQKHGGFEIQVLDLAKINLPFLDEPKHPRLQQYEHQHTKDWAAQVAVQDAFVIVTPEYNYSAPAPLINALDYLNVEWTYKPVGFVSYGGISAGTRSVQAIKNVVTTLKMMPLPEAVSIPFVTQFMKDGQFQPNDVTLQAAGAMLDELKRWAEALQPLRTKAGD